MLSKKNKGITLVALVITIIILLILAGISISALANTGIFQKAQDAEGKSKLADAKESMTLLLHEWQVEHVTSDKTLETFLGEKVADSTIEDYKKLENGNYEVYIKGEKVKDGAAFFAVRTGAKVIPVGISGGEKPFKQMTIRYGKPMDFSDRDKNDKEELDKITEEIMEEIIKLSKEK